MPIACRIAYSKIAMLSYRLTGYSCKKKNKQRKKQATHSTCTLFFFHVLYNTKITKIIFCRGVNLNIS